MGRFLTNHSFGSGFSFLLAFVVIFSFLDSKDYPLHPVRRFGRCEKRITTYPSASAPASYLIKKYTIVAKKVENRLNCSRFRVIIIKDYMEV